MKKGMPLVGKVVVMMKKKMSIIKMMMMMMMGMKDKILKY